MHSRTYNSKSNELNKGLETIANNNNNVPY